jgi:hypothetical protein
MLAIEKNLKKIKNDAFVDKRKNEFNFKKLDARGKNYFL